MAFESVCGIGARASPPACGTTPRIRARAGLPAAPLDAVTASASPASTRIFVKRAAIPLIRWDRVPEKDDTCVDSKGSARFQRSSVPAQLAEAGLERGDRAAETAGIALQPGQLPVEIRRLARDVARVELRRRSRREIRVERLQLARDAQAAAVRAPAPEEIEAPSPLEAVASAPTRVPARARAFSAAVADAAAARALLSDVCSAVILPSSRCVRAVAAASAVRAAVSRCAWCRQPIEKAAALTRPPQRKARAMSTHAERGNRRLRRLWPAVANGARSSRSGQLPDSEVTGERFAVRARPPATG